MEGEITPTSTTPSSCCSFDYLLFRGDQSFQIQKRRLLREIDEMNCRYEECFRSAQLMMAEIDLLRNENRRLASENLELFFLIEELEAAETKAVLDPNHTPEAEKKEGDKNEIEGNDQNPAPPPISINEKGESRRGTPKSISIRSSGFLTVKSTPLSSRKCGSGARSGSGDANRTHRLRLPVSPIQGGDAETGEETSGEVELDVFDQGTLKTELCNKWGEMGYCPYGTRCQFAHGLGELRPVIRHPRYKTQLCRMLTSPDGSGCPYGHRCHFRHSLPKAP
ncbi:butyrate response factor 1 protein [Dioscorea alata]|uniref:Butyrate response factor 1 protein n=1 Tax=Dioscorea alata TaxID=55571 RepID=A0ACB7VPF8_DIOAL|nr:butyrate response factor 1 protein [Dioscorea alata]